MDSFMFFIPFIVVVILSILYTALSRKNSSNSILVLKEFYLNENEDEFLIIKGKSSGSITSFICNKKVLKYESLGIKYNIPLNNITCISSGINKSVILLVLGIIFIIAGIGASIYSFIIAGIGVLIGCLLIILYARSKSFQINIFIGENKPMTAIMMKEGVIDGQKIDNAKFDLAVNLLNKTVLEIQS